MTMHLVGPYMTTTNYKKRKKKNLTNNQMLKLEQEWRAYNKRMRQQNCHSAQFEQFEQYLSYVSGNHKPKQRKFEPYVPKEPVRRETKYYPSLSNSIDGYAPKRESPKYTGDLIVGIATMHKSNAVPVMRGTSQAKDIAKMRR
jgi:hypothetical protein